MGTIRLISIILLCLMLQGMSTSGLAQELVNLRHIVQRGETLESMAEMYDVSAEMLKRVNDDMDTFYMGMEVMIPVDKKCTVCRDTHICPTCNGSGWQHSDLGEIHDHYGAGVGNLPCGNCSDGRSKGSGRCPFCK